MPDATGSQRPKLLDEVRKVLRLDAEVRRQGGERGAWVGTSGHGVLHLRERMTRVRATIQPFDILVNSRE